MWIGRRLIRARTSRRLEHELAFDELSDADLGALQIRHDRDLAPRALRCSAHEFSAADVVLREAVAEVQAHAVHAGADHLFEQLRLARCGAEGGNDLGSPWRVHCITCHGSSDVQIKRIRCRQAQAKRTLQPVTAERCDGLKLVSTVAHARVGESSNLEEPLVEWLTQK